MLSSSKDATDYRVHCFKNNICNIVLGEDQWHYNSYIGDHSHGN